MDSISVNTGCSSVKFQLFALDGAAQLTRKIKGQIEGIGTRPRFPASGPDRRALIDREYDPPTIADMPAAMRSARGWLREEEADSAKRGRPSRRAWWLRVRLSGSDKQAGARTARALCAACAPPPCARSRADLRHSCRSPGACSGLPAASIRPFIETTARLRIIGGPGMGGTRIGSQSAGPLPPGQIQRAASVGKYWEEWRWDRQALMIRHIVATDTHYPLRRRIR
jgi:hypothetical protein